LTSIDIETPLVGIQFAFLTTVLRISSELHEFKKRLKF
jgi:hypothetical protein